MEEGGIGWGGGEEEGGIGWGGERRFAGMELLCKKSSGKDTRRKYGPRRGPLRLCVVAKTISHFPKR